MADPQTVQQTRVMWFMVLLLFTFVPYYCLAPAVSALREPVGTDPSNPAIKESGRQVVWFWLCASTSLALANSRAPHTDPRVSRDALPFIVTRVALPFIWALGCVLCLLHLALAFHLGHGWSHEAAWEHTRQAGGFGDGIYANYAFAVAWVVDAIWLCVAYDSYFARSRWLHWTIHGFIAFIAINAAVVFGSWAARKSFAKFFALVAFFWLIYLAVRTAEAKRSAAPPSAE
jgi:hypothetical protein